MTNSSMYSLVADLIEELLKMGSDPKDLVWILTQYGFTEKFIKDNYGIPYDDDKDGNE